MAAKPTDLPEWATDPGADITEPPPGKKATGWTPLEKPPAQWFNWFFNLVYGWLAFLKDYAANHVHDGGTSDLSAPKVNPNTEVDWSTPVTGQTVTIAGTVFDSMGGIDTPNTIRTLTSGTVFSRIDPSGAGTFSEKVQVGYPIKATIHGDTGLVEAPNAPKIVCNINQSGGPGSISIGVASISSPNDGEYIIHPSKPSTSNAMVILATLSHYVGANAMVDIITSVHSNGDGTYSPMILMTDQNGVGVDAAVDVTVYY